MGINGIGRIINGAGDFGPMIFGTGERLLLPFGLQHILVALIRFTEAGGTMEVCGHDVSGALTIFQAQLSCPTTHGFSESATRFLSQGKMPSSAACRVRHWRCTTARARKTVIKLKAC
jgi:PTS system maltose and glucose-specific IIC component